MSADQFFEWKILFLLGFMLHNIEEGLWLPAWSQTVPRFQRAVGTDEFRFAAFVITVFGFLALAADLLFAGIGSTANYLFLGFAGMMGVNAVVPHLVATVYLRRYAPGVITGVLLNLPFSAVVISLHVSAGADAGMVAVATLVVSVAIVAILRPLFALGRILLGGPAKHPEPFL